ncbi:hypothetical protein CAI21_17935 [Alkalilimnicola ehrlichii]|uniref:DUF1488 domain-containing protein n=1 Tax=Alkalilimnicola ehrlichii TaxID=351052 RepID=A0A3E0WLZ6_9GAMM|nr:DUF1488 domain-containing protein [Alkalilimnicola ehrlichii]RFA25839.1 hypothetical protein CAI21_17935 [Alkalilimnicola ehrlichii]RFA33107.1 hypothetical protein CAL65_18250 [Alkalilimnicola ehrlichii]
MEINFPREEYLDATCDLIWFPAEVNGRRIRCVMEIESLQACCGADLGDPLPTFHAHRPAIESAAARLIAARMFARDGSIAVSADDL